MANAHAHMHPGDAFPSASLAAGYYFIRSVYQHPNLVGLTSTDKFSDIGDADTTTSESQPSGAGSGTQQQFTAFIAFESAVSFDRVTVVPGYVTTPIITAHYSNDGTNWTEFDGSAPELVPGFGYAGYGPYTWTNTQATARYFRVSVQDDAAASSKAGVFDLQLRDGVTERNP